MPHKNPMMEDDDEMMGGMGVLMEMPEEEPAAEKGEKKQASNFDMAADRVFSAATKGDSAGFRSALRSAIKIVVADMT